MTDPSDLSNEDLQKEHARTMVTLEGMQERLEEMMALGGEQSGTDPEELQGQIQAGGTYLKALEEEMGNRGMDGE